MRTDAFFPLYSRGSHTRVFGEALKLRGTIFGLGILFSVVFSLKREVSRLRSLASIARLDVVVRGHSNDAAASRSRMPSSVDVLHR